MFCYLGLGTEGNGQVMSFAWFVVQKGLIVSIDATDAGSRSVGTIASGL